MSERVNSGRKGKRGENEAAKLWRRWFPNCRRSFGQARIGYELPDLIGDIEKTFYVEVKRWKTATPGTIKRAWEKLLADWVDWQKLTDPGDGTEPVLMWRVNGRRWIVRVFEEFADELGTNTDGQHVHWQDFAAALDKVYSVVTPAKGD